MLRRVRDTDDTSTPDRRHAPWLAELVIVLPWPYIQPDASDRCSSLQVRHALASLEADVDKHSSAMHLARTLPLVVPRDPHGFKRGQRPLI